MFALTLSFGGTYEALIHVYAVIIMSWSHPPVTLARTMAMQWIRRAKTCLRPDGAAAGVTLAVMRRHLASGDAIPVIMPEYQELERVASEWEAWEVSASFRLG